MVSRQSNFSDYAYSVLLVLVPAEQAVTLAQHLDAWSHAAVDVEKLRKLSLAIYQAADPVARRHQYTPLARADIAQHIVQLSYARIMLQDYSNISLARNRAHTFGSMSTTFTRRLCRMLRIEKSSTFLDIGSGVANVVLQISLDTGCKAIGLEVVEDRVKWGVNLEQAVALHSIPWQLSLGDVSFKAADFTQWSELDRQKLFSSVHAIWMCNLVFDNPEKMAMMILKHVKSTVVVGSLKVLPGFRECVRHVSYLQARVNENIFQFIFHPAA
jgi:hypothetical protein